MGVILESHVHPMALLPIILTVAQLRMMSLNGPRTVCLHAEAAVFPHYPVYKALVGCGGSS